MKLIDQLSQANDIQHLNYRNKTDLMDLCESPFQSAAQLHGGRLSDGRERLINAAHRHDSNPGQELPGRFVSHVEIFRCCDIEWLGLIQSPYCPDDEEGKMTYFLITFFNK